MNEKITKKKTYKLYAKQDIEDVNYFNDRSNGFIFKKGDLVAEISERQLLKDQGYIKLSGCFLESISINCLEIVECDTVCTKTQEKVDWITYTLEIDAPKEVLLFLKYETERNFFCKIECIDIGFKVSVLSVSLIPNINKMIKEKKNTWEQHVYNISKVNDCAAARMSRYDSDNNSWRRIKNCLLSYFKDKHTVMEVFKEFRLIENTWMAVFKVDGYDKNVGMPISAINDNSVTLG